MKKIAGVLMAVCLAAACTTSGANNPHEDGSGTVAVPREGGPTLCKDGTVPPCNDRG